MRFRVFSPLYSLNESLLVELSLSSIPVYFRPFSPFCRRSVYSICSDRSFSMKFLCCMVGYEWETGGGLTGLDWGVAVGSSSSRQLGDYALRESE